MNRCKGLMGLLLGHNLQEVVNEEREYYPPEDLVIRSSLATHGPVKSEKHEHLYCVCMRCGQQVSRKRVSLFDKEGE